MARPLNFLCISSEFKGQTFLRTCHEQGNNVYLLTCEHLRGEDWPHDIIRDSFYLPEKTSADWKIEDVIAGLAFTSRHNPIDRVVALDDFDVEIAANLREYFRIPGMGQTTARHFRDKLSMRMKAAEHGIPIPAFTALFSDDAVNHFCKTVPAPWLIKPRTAASASGIQKITNTDELWEALNKLGEKRHEYLLESFAPGIVYHVDSINAQGKPVFTLVSEYLDTPFEVAHGGGIFRSQTLKRNSAEEKELKKLNAEIMEVFGMQYSASHTEFIKDEASGLFYFLETSSRVAGAHLSEMVEAATGISLWREWAILEDRMARSKPYKAPKPEKRNAGIVVSLARMEHPDDSVFTDSEIVWRMKKDWHIGLIVASNRYDKIRKLLDKYAETIASDFHASGSGT